MNALRALHAAFAWVVVASNLTVGIAGLVARRRSAGATKRFWTALAVAWATIYVQGLLGLLLFERFAPPFKHHFYGFLFAIVTIAVFPLRSEAAPRRLLVFSVASLFIGIVAVRASLSL